jgi:hypothetical protein
MWSELYHKRKCKVSYLKSSTRKLVIVKKVALMQKPPDGILLVIGHPVTQTMLHASCNL